VASGLIGSPGEVGNMRITDPSAVQVGDIIWSDGLRIDVDRVQRHDGHCNGPVWQCQGRVLNFEALGRAEQQYILACYGPERRWAVQGNTLARVGIEPSAAVA
jgi:hypothetical protein